MDSCKQLADMEDHKSLAQKLDQEGTFDFSKNDAWLRKVRAGSVRGETIAASDDRLTNTSPSQKP